MSHRGFAALPARRANGLAFALAVACFGAPAAAVAADAGKQVAQVPGDDIFGFTSPSDIGNPGDAAIANENDGRLGKIDGRYRALNQKVEFSRTLSEKWWGAASFFTAYNHARNVTGIADVDRYQFDGFSFEIAYKLLDRSPTNPFGVTLTVEPRWGRVDGLTGLGSNSWGATFKAFVDAPIVPDQIYWAANVQATTQTAQDVTTAGQWAPSSTLLLSTALTWQASPKLFFGAEARYFTTFDTARFVHPVGRALYIGPTFAWKITDKVVFNATWQPQVHGRSLAATHPRLDLDNFERAQFRAKLVWNF
jgi:hypothetical protein